METTNSNPKSSHAEWLKPSSRGALHASVQVILAAGLFAVLQLLASAHNVRFDMTSEQAFVLSEASRKVAQGLAEPVRVTIFYSTQESGERREMADLLDQFRNVSNLIEYRLLDLDRSPGLATKFGVSSYNSGVIESGGRDLALKSVDEQSITNALLKLSRRGSRTICFLTGHGEHSPESTDQRESYSDVAKALEREDFTIRTLTTVPEGGLPPDCTITVAAGPSHEFLPGEAALLEAFVHAGGRFMILIEPGAPESVTWFVRSFGVEAGDDIIVDDRNRFLGTDSFTPRIPIFDQPSFGNELDTAAVFPLARSVRPASDTPPDGMTVSLLALSSPDSWAMVGTQAAPSDEFQFRKGIDRPGPLPVAVLATVQPEGQEPGATQAGPGRLVVFGDADFPSNFYLNLLGNKDLFMSTAALLAEEPELIAVRSKGQPRGTLSPISLTAQQGRVILWVAVVLQPAVFVVAGMVVAFARRRRRGGR